MGNFCNAVLTDDSSYEGACKCEGLTSSWNLEDGGLMFCEDDLMMELDGFEETKNKGEKVQLIALTEKTPLAYWMEHKCPQTEEDEKKFTVHVISASVAKKY